MEVVYREMGRCGFSLCRKEITVRGQRSCAAHTLAFEVRTSGPKKSRNAPQSHPLVMDAEIARRVAVSFSVKPGKIVIAPDLAPSFANARGIKDPMNQSAGAFISTFDHLDRCVATMAALFKKTA